MDDQRVVIPLKRFLLIEQCPVAWKDLDLYLIRDEAVVFYVGQSYLAFERVWEHLRSGFKGHSIVGRFIWCNWPVSMKFTVELMSADCEQFETIGNDLHAAERELIRRWCPCFNVSQNSRPAPLPSLYLPPNARLRCSRSLHTLIREAERSVRAEEMERWMQEIT